MKNHLVKLIAFLSLLLLQTFAHAGTGNLFNVTATGTGIPPISITLCLNAMGPLSCQNYTISAASLSISTTVPNHVYPNVGIKINTPGYTLANIGVECTSLSNGYCAFQASNTQPKTVTIYTNPGPNPIRNPRFAYASSWNGNMLNLCSVGSDGTFSNCSNIPAPNSIGVNQLSTFPGGIAINSAGTIAYLADYTNGVFMCNINSNTGLLSNCTATGSGYSNPVEVSLNAAGTYAYIGDYSAGIPIVKCSVSSSTGALSNCTNTTAIFSYPTNVVFNAAGTLAYVGNYDFSQLSLCTVNQTNGDFSSCVSTPNTPTGMLYTTGVAINSAGSILYVSSNSTNTVNQCPINNDGTLAACTSTGTAAGGSGWPGFTAPFGMTLNAANTYAYIPNYDVSNKVTVCSVNASNGSLTNCMYTGSGFTSPLEVALLY